MKLVITVAFAWLQLLACTLAFAQSVRVSGYLPAGNIMCANPEKLADMTQRANWGRDIKELPDGCDTFDRDVPLRNARRAGKVVCFELVREAETEVCAHAVRVKKSR